MLFRSRFDAQVERTFFQADLGEIAEELFVLVTLGDERNVAATYVAGERVGDQPSTPPFLAKSI